MSETQHTVDPKFTYRDKRSGKDVVLYQGLLDAAHRAGLVDVTPVVLQFPNDDNAQTCIVMATARFADGRSFSSIGDANPKNVGGAIVPHFIRMAETRAKGRALRDALNVGMITVEELGGRDDYDDDAPPQPAYAPQRNGSAPTRPAAPPAAQSAARNRPQPLNAAPVGAPYDEAEYERLNHQCRVNDEALSPAEYARYHELTRLAQERFQAAKQGASGPNPHPEGSVEYVLHEARQKAAGGMAWQQVWAYLSDHQRTLSSDDWGTVVKEWKTIKAGYAAPAAPAFAGAAG